MNLTKINHPRPQGKNVVHCGENGAGQVCMYACAC